LWALTEWFSFTFKANKLEGFLFRHFVVYSSRNVAHSFIYLFIFVFHEKTLISAFVHHNVLLTSHRDVFTLLAAKNDLGRLPIVTTGPEYEQTEFRLKSQVLCMMDVWTVLWDVTSFEGV
jgi:hypothetical protein